MGLSRHVRAARQLCPKKAEDYTHDDRALRPSFENHTQVYIDTVSRLSGIGCDEVIDTRSHDHMVPIVAAMSRVENGVDANMSEVEQGWTLYMQHKA